MVDWHPLFTINRYLNSDKIKPDDTIILKHMIKSYMKDLYDSIETNSNGYIICTKPKINCTKKIAIIWVRKNLKPYEIFKFRNDTYPLIKNYEQKYTRIIVLRETNEQIKRRIAFVNIDRISWDKKSNKWVNSYNRTKKMRKQK